jgi:hypothetical protein
MAVALASGILVGSERLMFNNRQRANLVDGNQPNR